MYVYEIDLVITKSFFIGIRKPQAVLVVPKGLQLWTSKTSYVKI